MLKKSIHSFFPDHLQVLKRGFPVRILRGVSVLLFHDIFTGIIRTFITVFIPILYPFPAKNDFAELSTKLRLMIVRPIAALTRIIVNQGLQTDIAVQPARSHHICFEHFYFSPSIPPHLSEDSRDFTAVIAIPIPSGHEASSSYL